MNWKALLAVLITVGIIGLLMATDIGKNYSQLMSSTVGNFFSGILDRYMGGGEEFSILLDADKNAFYGQTYSVSNVTVSADGICQSSVTVGNTVMPLEGKLCSVEARNAKGQFEFTAGGSVKFAGVADMMVVDGYPFLPTAGSFEANFEVIPTTDFELKGLEQTKIRLNSVSGSIQGTKGETQLSIDNLGGGRLEVSNFNGDLKLDGESMLLVGLATSVKGKDFSW